MFDHAKQSKLARENPELFEEQARKAIDDFISSTPEHQQPRLRGIQFTIDTTLGQIKDPIVRMNKMVEIFWEGAAKFSDALHGSLAERQENGAEIIPFKRN